MCKGMEQARRGCAVGILATTAVLQLSRRLTCCPGSEVCHAMTFEIAVMIENDESFRLVVLSSVVALNFANSLVVPCADR